MTTINLTNAKHASQIFTMFSELREMEELCDIRLDTNVDELPVHKVVLSACSPYFRDVFKTLDDEEETIIISEEHNPKVVEAIIDYFYTGRLEIDASLLCKLIETAMFFQVTDIAEQCERKVIQHLSIDNCLEFYAQAVRFQHYDLQRKIMRYISCRFLELVEKESFLEIYAKTLAAIVAGNSLNIEQEEDVYEAIMKWYKHNETDRWPHLHEVFCHVRFFDLHADFIEKRVIHELFIGQEKLCKNEILQALEYKRLSKEEQRKMRHKLNSRHPSKVIYMFDSKSALVEKYCPVNHECMEENRLMRSKEIGTNEPILKHAIIVDNELYVVKPSEVNKFNSVTFTWEKIGEGVPIRDSCLCADVGCFYVIGGCDNGSEKKNPGLAVRCFNVGTMVWSDLPDITQSAKSAACVAHNKRIYVMGGFHAGKPNDKSYRFSQRSKQWKELKPMVNGRYQFSAIVIENAIYAIGGRTSGGVTNTVEIFDLNSQEEKWVEFTPMIKARKECSVAYCTGEIWCFGGRAENTIEKYDFKSQCWTLVGKLGVIRHGMSCVTYPML